MLNGYKIQSFNQYKLVLKVDNGSSLTMEYHGSQNSKKQITLYKTNCAPLIFPFLWGVAFIFLVKITNLDFNVNFLNCL
jgi:hypothetical protein